MSPKSSEPVDDDFQKEFISEIFDDCAKIISMLNAQVRAVVYFNRISKRTMLSDPYLALYVFGSFDSVAAKWGLRIRQKLAPPIIATWFTGYFRSEFCATEALSQSLFRAAIDQHQSDEIHEAIVAGGADGFKIFQGGEPMRLAMHYGYDTEAPISADEISAFMRYFKSQDESPTV